MDEAEVIAAGEAAVEVIEVDAVGVADTEIEIGIATMGVISVCFNSQFSNGMFHFEQADTAEAMVVEAASGANVTF